MLFERIRSSAAAQPPERFSRCDISIMTLCFEYAEGFFSLARALPFDTLGPSSIMRGVHSTHMQATHKIAKAQCLLPVKLEFVDKATSTVYFPAILAASAPNLVIPRNLLPHL